MKKNYDLIVIGAGILGTAHALQAARNGQSVLLLEKDNRPMGATVRNFGQAVPSGLGGKWHQLGRESAALYRQIQAEYDISVRANGSVYVASDEAEWQLAHEAEALFRQKDYPCTLLSAAETLDRYPYLRGSYVKGSLFFPDDLSVEPDRLVHRLIEYAQQKYQVTYRPNTAVVDCQPSAAGATVQAASGQQWEAAQVILCSGSEFRLLFPDLFATSGLIVSKLQMMQTLPVPGLRMHGNILTGLTLRRYESFEECPSFAQLTTPPHYTELKKWGIHLLFKQALDGSVIIGDSHEYASATEVNTLGYELKAYVNELILAEAERIVTFPVRELATSWAGYYAQHPDELYEHAVSPAIRIVTGIGGKGMTSSLGLAQENLRKWGVIS